MLTNAPSQAKHACMAKKISDKVRAAVMRDVAKMEQSGLSKAAIAKKHGISHLTVYAWTKEQSVEKPAPKRTKPKTRALDVMEAVSDPSTVEELRAESVKLRLQASDLVMKAERIDAFIGALPGATVNEPEPDGNWQ